MTFSYWPLHKDEQVLDDQLELIYSSVLCRHRMLSKRPFGGDGWWRRMVRDSLGNLCLWEGMMMIVYIYIYIWRGADIFEWLHIHIVDYKVLMEKYLRRTRKLLQTKLSCRNLIKGINTCAVLQVRYLGPFLKWTREELKQMDQRTRKLMTMHKALHPRDDVDRLYVSRKQGGRGLASIEDYIEKHERGLITTIRNETDNTIDERVTTTTKQKWEGKQLYGRFKRLINNISHQKTWTWLRKGNFKRETESFLIAAQDNAIRANHIKARIDKTKQNSKCRLCGDRRNDQLHNKQWQQISTEGV